MDLRWASFGLTRPCVLAFVFPLEFPSLLPEEFFCFFLRSRCRWAWPECGLADPLAVTVSPDTSSPDSLLGRLKTSPPPRFGTKSFRGFGGWSLLDLWPSSSEVEKYRTLVVPLTLLLQAAPLEEADVPSKSPACAEDTCATDNGETDAADVHVNPLTRAVARREANWAAVNAARLAMVVLCW